MLLEGPLCNLYISLDHSKSMRDGKQRICPDASNHRSPVAQTKSGDLLALFDAEESAQLIIGKVS